MAPWPEPETEQPKAPDKAAAAAATPDKPCGSAAASSAKSDAVLRDPDGAEPAGPAAACKPVEGKKKSGVSSLDDRGLQALLDEAIAYKNPKDREQSSALFKELLAKAEADEREHSGGQRGLSGIGGSSGRYRRGPGRKGDVSERNSRGGSLQNLVHALNSDFDLHVSSSSRKRGRRNPQPQVSVSARQREGGSLPCNVNADFCGAAGGLLRTQDDVGTTGGTGPTATVKKRDHSTPIDDVVTGNSYSYKLAGTSGATARTTTEDLSGYRGCHSSKGGSATTTTTTADSSLLDDLEAAAAAAPRGSGGGRRRELKKLGHSSDAIFPESSGDDPLCSLDDLKRAAKHDNERLIEFASYLNCHNNVERSPADYTVIEVDSSSSSSHSPANGPAMLGVGVNGSVRTGPDQRWAQAEGHKDDVDSEGTEMTPMDRASEYPSSPRPTEHEVDQPIISELFPRKSPRSNGEHMVQLTPTPLNLFEHTNFAGGDSIRSTLDSIGGTARNSLFQVSSFDKNMHLVRLDASLPRLPTFLTKESEKKSFDENGNALHQGSGSERKFKTRKNKTDNKNYVLSEKIPGHRGDTQDINELLHFIESSNCPDMKSSISGKNNRNSNGPVSLKDSKQRNSSSNGKRSEAGGSKVKPEKRRSNEKQNLIKSSSLEEISCTKLSDLTSSESSGSSKGMELLGQQTPVKSGALTRESRPKNSLSASSSVPGSGGSRGSGSTNRKLRESSSSQRMSSPASESRGPLSDSLSPGSDLFFGDPSEFHVVTKKQRKKKSGRSSSIGRNERNHHNAHINYHRESHSKRGVHVDDNEGGILYPYHSASYRSESPDHGHQRRKSTSSMPPSDKSADSSDLDSVHSLPISSTSPKAIVDKTSTSSGSTPQASYADIARMASAMSPPQGSLASPPGFSDAVNQDPTNTKWPSVGQSRPQPAPLWTANVTLHTATPLPASHEEGEQCFMAPVPPLSSSTLSSSTKRDVMTNTVSSPESELSDCSSVGNLLSDLSYPPLCESGKCPQTVTQCVQTFISQASRTSPAVSPGVTMANCVDVEDSAKRAASPAAFDSVRDNSRTNTLDRPAVIILDEAETLLNGDPELTFGFEINELLLSTCTMSSDEEAEARVEPAAPQPSFDSVASINLDKIVAFVGKAWEDVMKELPQEAGATDRVQFYKGQ